MKKYVGLAVALLVFISQLADAQATQPSLDTWRALVQTIADALVGDSKSDELAQSIPDSTDIAQFDSREPQTRFRLAHRVNGMSVLWQQIYPSVPATMVTDLAGEISADPIMPADLRRKLIPRDTATTVKADAVARKWIARIIGPESPDGMAVLIFWDRPAADSAQAAAPREPVFVLIKAGASSTVAQIRYGGMSEALNE